MNMGICGGGEFIALTVRQICHFGTEKPGKNAEKNRKSLPFWQAKFPKNSRFSQEDRKETGKKRKRSNILRIPHSGFRIPKRRVTHPGRRDRTIAKDAKNSAGWGAGRSNICRCEWHARTDAKKRASKRDACRGAWRQEEVHVRRLVSRGVVASRCGGVHVEGNGRLD